MMTAMTRSDESQQQQQQQQQTRRFLQKTPILQASLVTMLTNTKAGFESLPPWVLLSIAGAVLLYAFSFIWLFGVLCYLYGRHAGGQQQMMQQRQQEQYPHRSRSSTATTAPECDDDEEEIAGAAALLHARHRSLPRGNHLTHSNRNTITVFELEDGKEGEEEEEEEEEDDGGGNGENRMAVATTTTVNEHRRKRRRSIDKSSSSTLRKPAINSPTRLFTTAGGKDAPLW
jgi:hypothetical protein